MKTINTDKAREYYTDLEDKKHFTKLTNTGITDNLENVFDFAESYHQQELKAKLKELRDGVEKITPTHPTHSLGQLYTKEQFTQVINKMIGE